MSSVHRNKIKRIREGRQPRVIDLFAGCGGMSLGFQTAGCKIVGGVEIDEHAIRTHALNLFGDDSRSAIEPHDSPVDITDVSPDEFLTRHIAARQDRSVDIVVGGPPCQSFARVGRSKLREVAADPKAFLNDPRSNLYLRFLEYVQAMRPVAILMENVPDALNHGGHNIAEETCDVLSDMGYESRYTLLNSVYYGVPEMRERMFLLSYRREAKCNISFPVPTHWIPLPRGYEGSRSVALKNVRSQQELFGDSARSSHYVAPPEPTESLVPAITAHEAIGDLPEITCHLTGELKRGARRFDIPIACPAPRGLSKYGGVMREWLGFENRGKVYDHVIRSLPRDYDIFRRMNPDDQYPEAYEHALDLFTEKLEKLKKKGEKGPRKGSKRYNDLFKATVPPYDPTKFPNKWRKMAADKPARTLMAHLGKDGYSHIHYDSSQARTISVREAARLQSFPDGFVFSGTMNPAFRQIGNAVPPLMAKALAQTILATIRGSEQ